ncbi:MAG: IS256 family transposase [Collinsella sp.]
MPQEESVLRLGRDEALEAARLWQECGDAREFACRMLGSVMNALMDSEAQQMCGASRNERSDGRENSRNGYRPRSLKTAVGDVELEIPKLRHGTYYPEGMLARWSRVDTSVAAIVQEMYVCGVSTRKVERVASKLGISSLSSSEVSSLCSDLDAEVAEFRRRDLSGTPCCYLWLDATYMSCRVGSSVVSQGVVTAIGLGADGRKHFLGCDVVDTESEDSWAAFLGGLRERGLAGVRLVVPDSHAGLVAAVSRPVPGLRLAALRDAPAAQPPERLLGQARGLQGGRQGPRARRGLPGRPRPRALRVGRGGALVASVSARAGEVFEQAEDSALAFTAFPRAHWAKLRTNNVQERANREIKRRYRVVQSFPSRESMLRLTCASLMETEGQWSQQRVFSEASAAEGFAEPADRPAPTEGRRRALGRRAREIVDEIVEKRGLKKE